MALSIFICFSLQQQQYENCMMCSGFYGNNFGQPVCSTCHLFLFSVDLKEDGEEQDNRGYEVFCFIYLSDDWIYIFITSKFICFKRNSAFEWNKIIDLRTVWTTCMSLDFKNVVIMKCVLSTFFYSHDRKSTLMIQVQRNLV